MAFLDISCGNYHARINAHGGGIVSLHYEGRPLIDGYSGEVPYAAGAILAPWPNRLAGGTFTWHDTTHTLPLNEENRGNANHGLAMDAEFTVIRHEPTLLELSHEFGNADSWPWPVKFTATYEATSEGLTATYAATGPEGTPFSFGLHPYLNAQGHPARESTLQAQIGYNWPLNERLLPTGGLIPASSILPGVAEGLTVGDRMLDHCFLSTFNPDGYECVLSGAAGGVRMTTSHNLPWVQIFTADPAIGCTFPEGRGIAIAIEPMSAPPNVLNISADDAAVLAAATGHPVEAFFPGELRGDQAPLRYTVNFQAC